ncbi:MAG: hypothetical protein R2759_18700 [Bacteroidales bacterium]
MEALFAAKNEIETKLNGIQNLDEEINSVSLSLKSSEEALKQQAEVLTKRREGVFKPIQESVEATLKSLGMPHAQIALKTRNRKFRSQWLRSYYFPVQCQQRTGITGCSQSGLRW